MELELVLNELAFSSPAENSHEARKRMRRFVDTLVRAGRLGVSRVLRTQENLLSTQLAEGYSLGNWRQDVQVELEARQYFARLATKAPLTEGLPDLADIPLVSEYLFGDEIAHGLGVAAFIGGIAVSIDTGMKWNTHEIQLVRRWISSENDGEFETSTELVPHASQVSHLDEHTNWIDQRIKENVADGEDLWKRKNALLPNLEFCEAVREQIVSLGRAHVMLPPTIKRLFELDRYCRNWRQGGFDPGDLPCKVTPESEKTLNMHGKKLTFTCPDGVLRIFDWHARMTPGAWRLHFWPNPDLRRIVIGRIGRKPYA